MKSKLLYLATPALISSPIFVTLACSTKYKNIKLLRKHEYLVDKKIQDSTSRIHIDATRVKRQDIDKFPISLIGYYNASMGSSGYGETRHFYKSDKFFERHNGVDVFLNQGSPVYAPRGAEIIASYWYSVEGQWAVGIGGVVCYRIKIKDLNISDELKEYVYIKKGTKKITHFRVPKVSFSSNGIYKQINFKHLSYESKADYDLYLSGLKKEERDIIQDRSQYVYMQAMHLSKSSPNFLSKNVKTFSHIYYYKNYKIIKNFKIAMDIDIDHPMKLEHRSIMGFVGTPLDNGGWSPHTHINAYSVLSKIDTHWDKYKLNDSINDSQAYWLRSQVNSSGYVQSFKTPRHQSATEEENITLLKSRGNFDPNEIYDFYQNDDTTKTLET